MLDQPTNNSPTFDELGVPDLADIQTPFDMGSPVPEGESIPEVSEYDKLMVNMAAQGNADNPMSEIQSPFEAGQDQQQAMWGRAYEAILTATGGTPSEGIMEWTEEQERQAELTEIDGFGDKLAMALGQVSAGVVPALAGAVIAPIVGSTVATGALVTGTLGEVLSGIGETQQKALDLDPEYQADYKTLATGVASGAAGIPQLKRFTPAIKPMAELLDDVGDAVLNGTQAMTRKARLARGVKGVAETAALSGATEAVQDVGTSLSAHAMTSTVVDSTKGNAMAAAALDEFLIGGILGGGAAVATATSMDVADRQALYDAEKLEAYQEKGDLSPVQDATGDLDPDSFVPVVGAAKSPGTWNLFGTQLFGKSTDYLRKKFADNSPAQTFVQQVHSDPLNPQVNLNTVNEEAAIIHGNLNDIGAAALDASPELVEEAGQRRVDGTADLTNPIDKALHWLYGPGQAVSSEYNRVGRGNVDQTSFQWTENDYLPNANRVNWESIATNRQKAIMDLGETMRVAGRTPEQVNAATAKLELAIREQEEKGTQMFEGHELDKKSIDRVETIVEEGVDVATRMRKFIKNRRAEAKSLNKSPLNLSRAIPEAPQAFWEKYNDKGTNLQDAIRVDLKKKAEHLAYADKFGFDNEVAFELIGEAVIESHQPGRTPMTVKDVDNMMDILRLQQRLPTKRLSPAMHRVQLAVKSYTGTMVLGSAALMSIPETVITGYKGGIRAWANGTYNAIKGRSKESQRESLASMEDMGHAYEDAVSMSAARIGETVNTMPKWETWFITKMTGLPQVQFMLSAQALKSADYYLRRQVKEMSDPQTTQVKRNHLKRKMYQFGVNPDEAAAWLSRGAKKTDDYYNDVWAPKLYRELRTTIVEPHPVDKPVWMSAEHWFLVAQLKSFVFTFQNLVLNDSYKKMKMEGPGKNRELVRRAAPYLAMYILGQAGIMMLKDLMKGKDIEDDAMQDKLLRAIGQQGVISVLSDAYHGVAGRSGMLESVSPAAGFINRQMRGNTKLVKGIMDGSVSPEDGIIEAMRINSPNTLADPLVRMVAQEAGIIQ